MQTKPMLPDEAITKAYDEFLEKNEVINQSESWRDEPNDDECPICLAIRFYKCSCHTGNAPCHYCVYECPHTKGEVFDYKN